MVGLQAAGHDGLFQRARSGCPPVLGGLPATRLCAEPAGLADGPLPRHWGNSVYHQLIRLSPQRQQEVTETAADGGYSFAVRVGADASPVLATGAGPTIEAARAAALASPALNTIRGSIVAMQEAVLPPHGQWRKP